MPRWVKDLPTPQAITDTCKMRVMREMTRYKGVVKEYDVMNEPLHATYLSSVVGDSINWNCYKWAREADPDAELYINDYNVEFNWGDAKKYRDLILTMKAKGAPVTGVGMQAHFWDGNRPTIDELVKNVNIVAEAGLPIKFTEFDYGGDLTQEQQAEDFIKVITVAFSHPSIVGLIYWGLSDVGAWRANTGLFDAQKKPKLAADTLLYYTKTKWATNFDSTLDGNDPLRFNAYYGTYSIEVDFNGQTKVFTVPLTKANADSLFTLYEADAKLKGPTLLATSLSGNNEVKLIFDKPILSKSLKRGDFKFFSKTSIGLESVGLDEGNPNQVKLTLSKKIPKGEYISVSYFPGSMVAADSSKTKPFGPESIANPLETTDAILISESSLKIYPNPATDRLMVETKTTEFEMAIYNSIGIKVFEAKSFNNKVDVDVSKYKKGMYLISVKDSTNSLVSNKIIIK